MHRKDFIKNTCLSCLGLIGAGMLLESCFTTHLIEGKLDDERLIIPLSAFVQKKKPIDYLIVEHKKLKYPVCVFKEDQNYRALLMQCTHQGTELQVFGAELQCPAHGSSFDKTGKVITGPAERNLRSFKTEIINEQLNIILK